MKSLTSIALVLVVVLALAGCSRPPDPAPAGEEAARAAPEPADDSSQSFTDGFESGDPSEWKEEEDGDEETEDEETGDGESEDEQ